VVRVPCFIAVFMLVGVPATQARTADAALKVLQGRKAQ
jgi:hypothetical protein